ncbi:MAG: GNAT family N-acetyltransferase [Chloroflexota bacterium]|nr:GNAT family N-acetyltransferase [Chloroflexota bacterium]
MLTPTSEAVLDLRRFDKASPHVTDAARVYALTWGYALPVSEEFIRKQMSYPDFVGYVAVLGSEVVGMGFGTRSEPGQWWHDKVAARVGEDHPALQDAWVLTELEVLESHRGRGIGSRLHDSLLETQPYPHALLSTQVSNSGARRLYERLGWEYLHPGFVFLAGDPAYVVMRKELGPRPG